jgi:hypothetical protein
MSEPVQPKIGDSKVEINKLLGNTEFVNMIRDYLDKKKDTNGPQEAEKTDEAKELKENIESQNQTLEQALSQNIEGGQIDFNQQDPNLNQQAVEGENQNVEQNVEKKEEPTTNINQATNEEIANILNKQGIVEENKDLLPNQAENNINDPKNDLLISSNKDKDKDTTYNYRSSGSPSNSNTSSSGGDPRKYLGKKRYDDEYICKQICENKHSSPSLILLCKIIEEFTYSVVLDTLLKNSLSQNLKLDSLLQGLIDSEGINKVILMLLKFRA